MILVLLILNFIKNFVILLKKLYNIFYNYNLKKLYIKLPKILSNIANFIIIKIKYRFLK